MSRDALQELREWLQADMRGCQMASVRRGSRWEYGVTLREQHGWPVEEWDPDLERAVLAAIDRWTERAHPAPEWPGLRPPPGCEEP